MRFLKMLFNIGAYVFMVLCVIIAFFMGAGVMEEISFSLLILILFMMSMGTSAVISISDIVLMTKIKQPLLTLINAVFCVIVVMAIGCPFGFIPISFEGIFYVAIITAMVYAATFLLYILQSKKDAKELNDSLKKIKQNKK